MVALLLDNGEDVNEEARRGSIICTEDYHNRYHTSNLECFKPGRTALQASIENNHLELVDILLEKGADVNGKPADNRGATALQLAAMKGLLGLAKRLLELGADPNAPGAVVKGRTALEGAAEHGRIDMIQLLLTHGAKTEGSGMRQFLRAIHFAAREGRHRAATLLRQQRELTPEELGLLGDKYWLLEGEVDKFNKYWNLVDQYSDIGEYNGIDSESEIDEDGGSESESGIDSESEIDEDDGSESENEID